MCIAVVFAVITIDSKILLVNNRDKEGIERWTLPGGKVEEGESLYDALSREVLEETKHTVIEAKIAYIHEVFFTNISAHVRAVVFHTEIDHLLLQEPSMNNLGKSVISKKWISIQDLPEYIKNKKILSPLQDWLSHFRTSQYFISKDIEW